MIFPAINYKAPFLMGALQPLLEPSLTLLVSAEKPCEVFSHVKSVDSNTGGSNVGDAAPNQEALG